MKFSRIATVSSALAVASAQVPAYGQCGGKNYTGSIECVAGYDCLYGNDYYSQCVAGTASSTLKTTTKPSSTEVPSTTVPSAAAPTSSGAVASATSYAKVSGQIFDINGKEEYWAGTNSYWIGFLTDNADVDKVMSDIAATGLKVLRVWGFNDVNTIPSAGTVYFQSLVPGSEPSINTGADGLERLDYVVQSAAAHGVSLIINFVNNWDDYGGMAAYCTYYDISPVTNWYTNTDAQAQYQKYIAAVISRYKTSTAVFAWELANEPRCAGCDISVLNDWITTTSAYIKSLDPNHMVTIGDEGFGLTTGSDGSYPFQFSEGLNFTMNLAVPDVDFGTMHLYPSSWGENDTWGPTWITAHAEAAAAVGKPVILEEYGSLTHTDELPWQATVLKDQVAGDLYWQYGDTLSTGESPDDGYTIYYGTAEYAELVTPHAKAMLAKAV